MNAHLPQSVRVGTIEYRVSRDADEWMRLEHANQRSGEYGRTQHREATIYLNPDTTADVTRLTLWHEVLHALSVAVMGDPDWRMLPGAPDSHFDANEAVVRMLEHPTLAVLRDNPDLVAYLTS